MLNIPFLRKVARLLHILAWCYIIILFPATAASIWAARALWRADWERSVFRLHPPPPFPWIDFASKFVEGLAIGVCFMVLVQLAALGIKAIEHLRSLDEEEGAPPEQPDAEAPHGAGDTVSAPVVGSLLSRSISRVAAVLAWVMIGLTVGAVALSLVYPNVIPSVEAPSRYQVLGGALTLVSWLAWAAVMFLLSQGILWVEEAVAHLRSLAEWEEEADSQRGDEQP